MVAICVKKVKVAHTRLPSVGFRSWSQFLAVSLQVMWVINRVVGCHYFPPGLQLPSQQLRGLLPIFAAWWTEARWVWTVCLRLLPDGVVAVIWTRPFCTLVLHANHLATEPLFAIYVLLFHSVCYCSACWQWLHAYIHTRAFQFRQKKFRFDSIRQNDKFAASTLIFN